MGKARICLEDSNTVHGVACNQSVGKDRRWGFHLCFHKCWRRAHLLLIQRIFYDGDENYAVKSLLSICFLREYYIFNERELCITNTYIKHKAIHKYTWYSLNYEIVEKEYLCACWVKYVKVCNLRALRGIFWGIFWGLSDHMLVLLEMMLKWWEVIYSLQGSRRRKYKSSVRVTLLMSTKEDW